MSVVKKRLAIASLVSYSTSFRSEGERYGVWRRIGPREVSACSLRALDVHLYTYISLSVLSATTFLLNQDRSS